MSIENVEDFLNVLNEAKDSDYEVLIDQLINNEDISDKDMVDFVAKESGLDKSKLKKFIEKYRDDFFVDKDGITGWKTTKLVAFVKKNF